MENVCLITEKLDIALELGVLLGNIMYSEPSLQRQHLFSKDVVINMNLLL